MGKFERDLTSGSVTKQLIRFSLPFLLSNFLQAMYNVMDTWIVSRFAGADTVTSVAQGGQITLIATNLAIGFTVGGTILISQYFGAGKREELSKTIGTMLTSLAAISVVLAAGVILFSKPILQAIGIPEASLAEGQLYMNICMAGVIFTFGYNAIASILRGMGDSKSPLFFALIAGCINTALDFPLVLLLPEGMKAAGDAVSTVFAQAVSLVLAMRHLKKKGFVFEFKLDNFRIDKEKFRALFKLGLPNSIQNLVVGFSFLLMTVLVNALKIPAAATAVGIVGKFNGFAILPAIAMSAAVSSMAAQNLGAGLFERARKTMYSGMLLAFPLGAAFFLWAFLAPESIMKIFIDDPAVIAQGILYIKYFSLDYLFVTFFFCVNGLLMGAGLSRFTMINGMMSSVLLRIPVAYLFGMIMNWGLEGIGLAAPAATVGAGIIGFIYYKMGKWKRTLV